MRVALVAVLVVAVLPVVASASSATFTPGVDDAQDPSVAYDPVHGAFFVVASADDGRVYGSRIGATGKVVGAPIPISPASAVATVPAVVWDGSGFVVAWQADVAGCGHDIRAARLNAGGVLMQSDIAISPCAGDQNAPAIATHGSSLLIAWSNTGGGISDRTFAATTGIGAVHDLTATGTNPALSWNGIRFLVVWTDAADISGQLLLADGSTESEFSIASGPNVQIEPAVASNGQDFLVTWTELGGTYDVLGMRVDADGALMGPAIGISTVVRDQGASAVAFDGTNYLVVWNDSRNDGSGATYDVFGARVSPVDGSVIESSGAPISVATAQQLRPAVAAGGTQFLTVWQDNRNGQYDVYAARVTTGAVVEDASGFPVFAAPTATQASITLALDKSSVRADGRETATLTVDASTGSGPLANASIKLSAAWGTPKSLGSMKFLPGSTITLDANGHATATVTSTRSGNASIVATVKTRPYSGTEFIELQARRRSIVVFANGAGSETQCPTPTTCFDPGAVVLDPIRDALLALPGTPGYTTADMPLFSYSGGDVDATSHEWLPKPSSCVDSAETYAKSIALMRSMLRKIAGANPNSDFTVVGLSQGGLLAFQMLGVQTTPLPKGSRLAHVITLDSPLGGAPSSFLDPFINAPDNPPEFRDTLTCWSQGAAPPTLDALWNTTTPAQQVTQGADATVMCKVAGVPACATLTTNQQLVAARPDVDVDTWGSTRDSVFWSEVCSGLPSFNATATQDAGGKPGHMNDEGIRPGFPCTLGSHVAGVPNHAAQIAATIGPQQ